jgi:hypothetical protein
MRAICKITLCIGLIGLIGQTLGQEQHLSPDELVDIRPVPVGEVFRVTRADGNVFYVSGNRRWAFSGPLMDLWTGEEEANLNHHNRMSWEMSGKAMEDISLTPARRGVVFVREGCAECRALLERAPEAEIGIAPIQRKIEAHESLAIWCEQETHPQRIEKWLSEPGGESAQHSCQDKRAAGAMAFAYVYGLINHEASAIDADGVIYYGKNEVRAWLQEIY